MNAKNKNVGTLGKTAAGLMLGVMSLQSIPASFADALATPQTQTRTLEGTVKASQPIGHATIRVLDSSGRVLATQEDATNENGYFTLSVPGNATSLLTIEARNGQGFEGTLYGTLDTANTSAPAGFVAINPATTLSSLVRQLNPNMSAKAADARVQQYLGLPSSMSLDVGTDNPSQTLFSPITLEQTAKKAGGWDQYSMTLALEANSDSNATHSFPAPKGFQSTGPASWLAEKLLAGVAGKIGADLFSGFLSGIGFPGEGQQTLAVLNQVMARLAEIQAQLSKIEIRIAKGDYNGRTSTLVNEYNEYIAILDNMKKTDEKAKNNLDKSGKVIDPAVAADVKKAGEIYIQEMIALGSKFVTHSHAQLMPNALSMDPLSKVFAEFTYLEAPLITKKYFDTLEDHIDKFKLHQAVTVALVADAQKTRSQTEGESTVKVAQDYMKEEKPIYPNYPLFTSKDIAKVSKGEWIFDKDSNLVWDTHYAHFYTCSDYHKSNASTNPEAFKDVSYDAKGAMIDRANALRGSNGARYSEVIKDLGFAKGDYDDVKMIVHGCGSRSGHMHYNWFGNDTRGPRDQFYDVEGQFNKVKKDKGMGAGFYSMRARGLMQ